MDLVAHTREIHETGVGRKVRRDEVPCGLRGCGKQGTSFIIQTVKLRPHKPETELTHVRCEGHLDRVPDLPESWLLVREDIQEVPVVSGIRCGACRGKHRSVEEVRVCSRTRSSR